MVIKRTITALFIIIGFNTFSQTNLIPRPQKLELKEGVFEVNNNTQFLYSTTLSDVFELFLNDLDRDFNLKLKHNSINETHRVKNAIYFNDDDGIVGSESYYITIDEEQIYISTSGPDGDFLALQTLKQLVYFYNGKIPAMEIYDFPKYKHRGLLLDCSRHFFSVETIKKYVDALSFYKMNVLHWHLTEDQGWRLAIDKYPKLTEVAAWRTEKDGSRYGGFYTKEEIKELVAYAEVRNITIIPEIEMPGHSQAAIAAYPHLSCTGKQVDVVNDWGVFKEIYCAGNDSVFTFLEDVLTEVMELFPSKYIHIGGDEVPKYRWQNCAKCQKRIVNESLEDEHELQSYFIKRIEKFLNENNRELIGWDEILEGGLSPNATVQSWRGMDHGKHAAEMNHNVIMSPTSHCYLDYGLDAINLELVYSFNPIPKGLTKDKHPYIIGGEVNIWTEHVPHDTVLDNKVFPRVLAMAELLWSGPDTGFYDFYNRLQSHYPILDKMTVNYGLEAEPISASTFYEKGNMWLKLTPGIPGVELVYSMGDGFEDIYEKPIGITKSFTLGAAAFKNGKPYGQYYQTEVAHHLALGKEVRHKNIYSPYYTAGGNNGLTDGLKGTINFRDGRWQGFSGSDIDLTIDLGKAFEINGIGFQFYHYNNAWIFAPKEVIIQASSDGKNWTNYSQISMDVDPKKRGKHIIEKHVTKTHQPAFRYIRFIAKSIGKVPDWHEAAGSDSWIFIDELEIY